MQPHRPSNQASDHSARFPHARNSYNKFYRLGRRLPLSSGLSGDNHFLQARYLIETTQCDLSTMDNLGTGSWASFAGELDGISWTTGELVINVSSLL
ncbi:hypothetical protein PtA15_7A527 [Puccinia triticina]|uniref:Uncharacterized protein n=1 Tax=Puccinia triticina TaxID=208348 RepID=A0ABY7CNH9_9BASI|nr:uncharacterized protein PtA15_7A527 [Puccinia triticina]WAQ86798.1 hypothetical protein PtA15_7A527 [Puccinia triticina]